MNFSTLYFDTLASTNTEALEQARRGAAEGLCVVAGQQTAGRGRHGRVWSSPPNAGLYFSIVLRPRVEPKFVPLLTLAAGVAVHDTLTEFGLRPDIKWVNDILVGGKKISGILAETAETPAGTAVVVGIGINLTSDNFPPEIAASATSISAESGSPVKRDDLLAALTKYLGYFYAVLNEGSGPDQIIKEWTRRSTFAEGKRVRVRLEGEAVTGTTCGVEQNGALRLKTDAGEIKMIQAGDVEQLRPA